MAASDFVANMTSTSVQISASSGQVIKVVLINSDGSQAAVLSEQRVPSGKSFTGGYSITGTVTE